ncbi:MAG: AMP-dependent synthetase, partial [Candidatus Hydrogenedentota bacterium]
MPINFKLAGDAVQYILDDADVKCVFVDAGSLHLSGASIPIVNFDADYEAFLDPGEFADVEVTSDQVSMQLYT